MTEIKGWQMNWYVYIYIARYEFRLLDSVCYLNDDYNERNTMIQYKKIKT